MLKRFTLIATLSLFLSLGLSAAASAHILRTDGAVSAELHTEPYDHPLAGQSTVYHLFFEDEPAGFNLGDYTGSITILQGSKTLQTKRLVQTSPGTSQNSFTFPAAGSYTVNVSASTTHTNEQASFKFSYPVQVAANPAPKTSVNPAVWIAGGAVLLGIIAAAVIMERGGKNNPKAS